MKPIASVKGLPPRRPGRPATPPQRDGLLYPATPEGCLLGMRDLQIIQAQVAKQLRISAGFLSEVLRGRSRSQRVLNRLAAWLTVKRQTLEANGRFRPPAGRLGSELTLSSAALRIGWTRASLFRAYHHRMLPPWFRVVRRGGRYWVSTNAVTRLSKWRQQGGGRYGARAS